MLLLPTPENETKNKNHFVPSNIVKNSCLQEAPLCTVMVTFKNDQSEDVTSAYVFTSTTPQLYPQTRKTAYHLEGFNKKETDMSFSSQRQRTDDAGFTNSTFSPSSQLIQEVSLSYSPPYTSAVKPNHKKPIDHFSNDSVSDYHYEKLDGAQPQSSRNSSRLSNESKSNRNNLLVKQISSPNRITADFPVGKQPEFSIPYFSAQAALQTGRVTPIYTPPVTPSLEKSRALSQNTIVLESESFEELTTIVTLHNQKKPIKPATEMPTVNALTKQFESRKDQDVSRHSRVTSNAQNTQRNNSKSRIVVIDRQEKFSNQATVSPVFVYTPGGILTTTIVDVEPVKFGRRTEEYKIQEEYIVRKYDNNAQEHNTFQQTNFEASQQADENRENKELHVDTSPIDQVKKVVELFEIQTGGVKTLREKQQRSVSRVDMNENNHIHEKVILHQRSKTEQTERLIPITTVIEKSNVESDTLPITEPPRNSVTPTMAEEKIVLEETAYSPPLSIPTPSPTLDTMEKIWQDDNQETTSREQPHSTATEKIKAAVKTEFLIKPLIDKEIDDVSETVSKPHDETPETVNAGKTEHDYHYENILDRDYRIKIYEDWSTTSRQIKQFQSREPRSYSSANYRSKSNERTWEGRFEGRLSRSYSEGRGLASGAFGGIISGNLVSGMSSAGAICTSQIRDAREREKREIGLLNDRLADYIEKVRFLEAQNQCLSHDIDILRRGFSGGGHVSGLFNTEIARAKQILEQTIAGRAHFERDINALSADLDGFKKKWLDSIAAIKAHREDHDVDLDRLAKIEAEISLFKRKIRIVEEDVIRIRRENDGIYNEIARVRGLTHNEVALKNERRLNVDDLLQRIKLLETENSARIEQELVFIRRDTTAENRDYFRHELQAAIRDIRADYEQISQRNRNDIEVWYREQIRKIQADSANRPNIDLYKEELVSIRSTVLGVKSRLAEVESRNFFLERLIADLKQSEEAKMYEISLAEKDAAISRLRDQCTELSIQMEKLCDNETSLRAEIERYRVLLNGANVTTYVSNTGTQGYAGTTRVVSQTTRTHSSSNTSYTGLPATRSGGITVGGNIGGISVGGTIGSSSVVAHASGNTAEKRPDRVHDDKGVDENGRSYRSWYLGTISINRVEPDFIELKNICKIRRVDVGGFRVEQSVNDTLIGSAQILVPLILAPQETLRFYNASQKHQGEFFMDVTQFDTSVHARTSLYNYTEPQEERGWFVFLD